MRFGFLEEHRGEIGPVKKACGPMEASRSGFYEHLGRKKSNAQIERGALEGFVVEAFHRHKGRCGCRRIAEKAAIDSIGRAVGREGPPDDGGLVFHDGQSAQHASRSLRRCLDPHGIAQSASRPGTPPGNAAVGSFSKTLKRESVEGRSYGTRDGAKQDIFKRIGLYCNRARMHSALDCMSPVEYERQYA